ncbi:uncharacterized protein BDZ99DRAFT_565091 [Mytilinidion resinicola]|uniref:Pex N-terminal domain-containing protein n=1 Tax=Mytilinidion resinicola TaxID=574789 RepID=A0A6A6ZAK7_9PEZI|nr:uncharacterized protein BDZ99DRAFT_565091 [Mytilinidion resinicola]KAF2817325.1 hypothetical protein BDZ99DRAFT_565091 [Mytilinidion resinicola]
MPSADFAAAQERIAARRAQRDSDARARAAAQNAANASTVARLPYPFNRLGNAGLSVWDAISGREGTRPAFRVGQVDAELLDDELLELLKGQVGEGLKYLGSHITDTYSPEILLALRAILFKLSIWDHNASYGALLQGLRYSDARSNLPSRPPPEPWQKVVYGLTSVGGRYVWTKWEEHLLALSEDYTHESTPQFRLLTRITELTNSAHDAASLISFLVFLTNGRYRTILDRILRLRLTPTSHATSREVSFEYLNRQLVWHAFTEFLLFLLPLVGISRWRRILARGFRKAKLLFLSTIGRSPSSSSDPDAEKAGGELGFLPQRTCAICYRDQNPINANEADIMAASAGGGGVVGSAATDITNPYEAVPCGCVYCFACLAQRVANEEGEGWTCLRCGEVIKECKPWNGDVLEERTGSRGSSGGNGKTVGFAADGEEEEELREVDPVPEADELEKGVVASTSMVESETQRGLDGSQRLSESFALNESEEWGQNGMGNDSSDEQSEEYDEDEEEEGNDEGYED